MPPATEKYGSTLNDPTPNVSAPMVRALAPWETPMTSNLDP